MKKFLVFFAFVLIGIGLQQPLFAQTISVTVTVKTPYSLQAKDYIQQGNNVVITMTNISSIPVSAKVLTSLEGINNSIKIKINPTYLAPVPLNFGPSETKVMTLNQLKTYNGNPGFNDIIFQGYDSKLYYGNGNLPEGMYKVCADVVTGMGAAGGAGGTFSGCGIFQVQAYEPPIILNPSNAATVKPLQPQNVLFNWTPSGMAGKTNYTFKLVDLTQTPVNNPNDAFLNNVQPFFQQQGIILNNLVYDMSKLKLKEGHKYALQITAYDPAKKLLFKNNGKSPVTVFYYKNEMQLADNPANQPKQNDAPAGPCVSATKWNGVLVKTSKDGLTNGTTLAIGNFVVKNTIFTKKNGGYDGTGEVLVNFLHTKLKVDFKNIKVNADNRVYEGAVTGMASSNTVINDAMRKDKTGVLENVPNMESLMNYIDDGKRAVNKLSPNKVIDLPVHFDKNDFNIGIVGMIFEPTEAYINTVLNTPLPQSIGNNYLLLTAKGIPVHPNGYGTSEIKMALAKDISVILSDKLSLDFIGGANKTFALFSCDGFKSLTLNGAVTLDRSIAMPLDNNYNAINDNEVKVKAPFEIKNVKSINELLLDNISFSHKFAVPQAIDFAFDCKDLSIDLSNTENGTGFNFAYPDKKNKKDWNGIYVKNITLILPEGFKKKVGGRMTISAQNAYVDKMGFSGIIEASGKMFSEGTLAGWGIELNSINLKLNQSKLAGGGFGGIISLPLGDKTDLGFKAIISKGDANGAAVALKVETKDEVDANLFFAKIKLFEGSSIEVGKDDGKYFAKATLNGEIGIDINSKKENSNVGKFNLPTISFQELTIDGKDQPNYVPNFDLKFAALQNNKGLQAKIGTFEMNLNELAFKKSADKKSAGLSFDLGLSLFGGEKDTKNGAGATTAFTIWAKHNGAGLMYTDKNIEAGKQYAYSISINSKEKKQAKDEALVFINDTRSSYQSPQPEGLIAEEGEGFVKLIWNNTTNHQLFSAYNIERSGDGGKTFKKINELPYMSVAENTDKFFYTDSVKNYISYLYRIKGITPWIDESDPSDFVKAMGRDKTAASPPMNTRAKGDRSKITVTWELPATSPDLKGFQVARSHNLEGPFTSINKESVSPANRMFVDEKPSPKEPYYVVYAVDTAGNYSSTFSVMANVYDTAAPSQPLILKGFIDSNGVVKMSWKFGSDNDLVGYNVYVANGKDNIYRQITGSPLLDSVFTDTVSMRSLTKNVYYKITAVDYNNNASEYSELMVLERPDVIPPAAPLISNYAVTDNKVTLTLVGSSSDDVIDHKLIRTDASGQKIILLTAKDVTTFTDEKVTEGASYSYSLVATDVAKHQTTSKALQITILEMEIKAGISKLAARTNEKDKQVLLSWNLLDKKPEQTLVLFRSINGEEMKFYKKLSAEKESFTDNAEAGKYAYAIKVLYNNGAESELSETAFAEIKN